MPTRVSGCPRVRTSLLLSALGFWLTTSGLAAQPPQLPVILDVPVVTQQARASQSQEDENRRREIEIQERISYLTRLLVIVGGIVGLL
jgi:hypothetical protein